MSSRTVDERCDVWGLAMTFYYALSGRAAFEDKQTFAELLMALNQGSAPSVLDSTPWTPPSLARAIHAALPPSDRRFPSIEAFSAALARADRTAGDLTTDDLGPVRNRTPSAHHVELPRSFQELTEEDDPIVGRRVGRFLVQKRLAQGGMGAVYEATDEDGSPVALKLMLQTIQAQGDGVRSFFHEAKAARALDSPYVTRMLGVGVDEALGAPYIAMELLRGRDLGAIIRERAPLAPGPLVSLLVQACQGVECAYALGIVHRDIKPGNIFIHENPDGTVIAKLCDFGLAKQLDLGEVGEQSTELTHTGSVLGSPLYMSPEQAKNAKLVDVRSDVYSLALSLHEALTGRRPWPGLSSMGELILAICTEDVPPVASLAPWLNPSLATAVDRALVRALDARTPSARDFRLALVAHAKSEVVRREDLVPVPPAMRASAQWPSR